MIEVIAARIKSYCFFSIMGFCMLYDAGGVCRRCGHIMAKHLAHKTNCSRLGDGVP